MSDVQRSSEVTVQSDTDDMRVLGMALAVLSAAGITGAITLLYRAMGTLMGTQGGSVASGGPYVIANTAPSWIGIVPGAIMALFLFGAINVAASEHGWGISLVIFAWMGLFVSLGWNFLRLGLSPPPGMQGASAWIFCGILFWVMGLGPASLLIPWFREGFRQLVARQSSSDARRVWRLPEAGDTTGAYLAAQAVGALLGVAGGLMLFASVIS